MLEEVYLTIVRLSIREAPSSDLPAHSKNFLPAFSKNPPSAANAKFGHATVTKRVPKMQNPENCKNRTRYCYKTCPILIPRGEQITGPPRRFIFRERKKAKTPCVTLLHSNNRKGFQPQRKTAAPGPPNQKMIPAREKIESNKPTAML